MPKVRRYTADQKVWFTSDLHINHDKPFVWGERGFDNVQEMNDALIKNFNEVVGDDDEVWILGDVTLGPIEAAIPYLKALKGHIHVVRGNHDTDHRVEVYESLGWEVVDACFMKYGKQSYFLSHFPASAGRDSVTVLFGHVHHNSGLWHYPPLTFHVGVDEHNLYPIPLEEISQTVHAAKAKFKELVGD